MSMSQGKESRKDGDQATWRSLCRETSGSFCHGSAREKPPAHRWSCLGTIGERRERHERKKREYKRADWRRAGMNVMTSSRWNYPLLTGFGGHQRLCVRWAVNVDLAFLFFFLFLF